MIDKNYLGNSPVSHEYTYSYQFNADGKLYTGDSNDPKLVVGDTINVRYVIGWPSINDPK